MSQPAVRSSTRSRYFRLLLPLTGLLLALAACITPLDYEMVITVNDAGGYEMTFDGTIGADALKWALMDGTPPEELQADVDNALAEMQEAPSVEASEYRGDSVFYVRGAQAFDATSTNVVFDLPLITAQREPGKLTFTIPPFDEGGNEAYAELGYEHDGHIILRGGEILESNGRRGPRGHYWDDALIEQEGVHIVLATPNQE